MLLASIVSDFYNNFHPTHISFSLPTIDQRAEVIFIPTFSILPTLPHYSLKICMLSASDADGIKTKVARKCMCTYHSFSGQRTVKKIVFFLVSAVFLSLPNLHCNAMQWNEFSSKSGNIVVIIGPLQLRSLPYPFPFFDFSILLMFPYLLTKHTVISVEILNT